ncbi:glycoside hydrolase family 88 protein [Bacillus sp. B15-48]|uniref:glycoside hydrolase family 88 protein n=1 Tax=Bacillus sp. B15-48 TaxID=1548601 RepID=UPI00193FF7F1|nr:glycoside hydrolase family 88 protein [Bacillus sp. B15-48]MBM4761455.1 hypothetical protein [Bacillus sp. B15-48]
MYKESMDLVTLNQLRKVTREQLNNYPNRNLKAYIKLSAMSLLKRKNLVTKDSFFWPNGLLATSLEWGHRVDGNREDLRSLKKYYDNWIKKGIPLKNSDYAINGYSLVYLYNKTGHKKYLKPIELLINYLKSHQKTEVGSIPYRIGNPNHVLVDSLGMVCPFLCRYGNAFNDDSSINLAIDQLTNFVNYGMDKESGLPYHGYNLQSGTKLGIIGWGRAIGWQLIGLVDSLEYIPKSHEKYEYLCNAFKNIVQQVVKYQRQDGNFTWQITAKEGYIDTSSTSMISYAIRRGVMLKILPDSYFKNTNLALGALYKSTTNGVVQNCSAECRGVSMYPQTYGNYPWAQGPTTAFALLSIK